MSDITIIEIGSGLLAFWLVTIAALSKLIDRRDRPGPIKSALAKESLMLTHLAIFLFGMAMVVKGFHVVD
jgi:4-amino-4-deoxy-L-arabinose transferase-like glycosyltransferase